MGRVKIELMIVLSEKTTSSFSTRKLRKFTSFLIVVMMKGTFLKAEDKMNPFTKSTIDIIQSIPEGRIMTYGQIANLAGNSRGARQVVRVLHSMSHSYNLPWHRVINAKGEIAIKDDESHFVQVALLKSEGIEIDENERINIEKYRYHPL